MGRRVRVRDGAMVSKFYLEALGQGDWKPYFRVPFDSLEDVAHECRMEMTNLQLNHRGVRIRRIDYDQAGKSSVITIVYQKTWEDGRRAPETGGRGRGLVTRIVSSVLAVLLALLIAGAILLKLHLFGPTVGPDQSAGLPAAAPAPLPVPVIRQADTAAPPDHSATGEPEHNAGYLRKFAELQRDDEMEKYFRVRPLLSNQAEDVVNLLGALDSMTCNPRQRPKQRLTTAFLQYVARTTGAAADKDQATSRVAAQSARDMADLPERDIPLHADRCGELFAMSDVYSGWFERHK